MFLTNVNIFKIFTLHILQENSGITLNEMLGVIRGCGSSDVSLDLLSKTIKTMVKDGLLYKDSSGYSITRKGQIVFENYKENLLMIAKVLFRQRTGVLKIKQSSNMLSGIRAFKTVPYRISSQSSLNEENYFKEVVKNSYRFAKRGMGKAKLYEGNKEYEYCYGGYAILFFNSSLVRFVGIADEYDNISKSLYLSQIIKLNRPISAADIRKNVRKDFMGSQQKQEFVSSKEVGAILELIRNKVNQYGCEVYSR